MPIVTPGRAAGALIAALGGTDAGGGSYTVGSAQAQIIYALGGTQSGGASNHELREDGGLELREDGGTELRE